MGVCAIVLFVIATVLGPVTLVFMGVSFGTDHWLEFRVNTASFPESAKLDLKNNPQKNLYHLSRDRGMFRECYPGNDSEVIRSLSGVVDGNCFNIDYDLPSTVNNPSDSYMSRIHLNRSFLAFYIISIVLFVLAYIFGLVLCCLRVSKWAYVAAMFAYTSAFFLAAAIAFFHGAEYIERNKLTSPEFYQGWPDYLKRATSRTYAWSYALAWVAMILATISATFYSLAGCYLTRDYYEDEKVLHKRHPRDYPLAMEPVYALPADPYYGKFYGYPQAYMGPWAPEFYARPYPSLGYGEPRSDIYHWRQADS